MQISFYSYWNLITLDILPSGQLIPEILPFKLSNLYVLISNSVVIVSDNTTIVSVS